MAEVLEKELRNKYITFINNEINELALASKVRFLQIIYDSDIDKSQIYEKGNGTQLRYDHISDKLMKELYDFIINEINNNSFLL